MAFKVQLLRPDDLLNLHIECINLRLDTSDPQAPAPVVAAPSPVPVLEVAVRPTPLPKKLRVWPTAVGVAAAGVAAAVIIGLSVGLTRPGEPVIDWSAR